MESKPDSCHPKGEFTLKLSRYSAVTVGGVVGTMAAFESSEAAMIVTNTLITLVNDATAVPTAEINLNGVTGPASLLDGSPDVRVTVATASLLEVQGAGNLGGPQGFIAGTVGPQNFFYPTAFETSNRVGPSLTFSANSTQILNTFGTLANGSIYGNWAGVTPVSGYIGVKFDIAGNDHFGWVHLTWDPGTSTATIDQYAYNSDPGVSAHVPEPSSLLLLGLGAVGLGVRRRRREEA